MKKIVIEDGKEVVYLQKKDIEVIAFTCETDYMLPFCELLVENEVIPRINCIRVEDPKLVSFLGTVDFVWDIDYLDGIHMKMIIKYLKSMSEKAKVHRRRLEKSGPNNRVSLTKESARHDHKFEDLSSYVTDPNFLIALFEAAPKQKDRVY